MIQFNDIKLHDLVFLDSEGIVPGWFLITGVSKKVGFFTAAPLGDMDHSVYVDDMDIVRKHYSATGLLDAVPALIEIAAGKTTMADGATVCMVMFEAQEIAEAALRAVRGGGIGMTHTPGPWWKSYDLGTYEIPADGGEVNGA